MAAVLKIFIIARNGSQWSTGSSYWDLESTNALCTFKMAKGLILILLINKNKIACAFNFFIESFTLRGSFSVSSFRLSHKPHPPATIKWPEYAQPL